LQLAEEGPFFASFQDSARSGCLSPGLFWSTRFPGKYSLREQSRPLEVATRAKAQILLPDVQAGLKARFPGLKVRGYTLISVFCEIKVGGYALILFVRDLKSAGTH
jgi:hypothetical protein